eukprot:13507923-Heterocapsa_arctica.AAC.1
MFKLGTREPAVDSREKRQRSQRDRRLANFETALCSMTKRVMRSRHKAGGSCRARTPTRQ